MRNESTGFALFVRNVSGVRGRMLKTSRFQAERAQYTVLEDREARQIAEQIMMREYRNIIPFSRCLAIVRLCQR